jgi:hypothetical protein
MGPSENEGIHEHRRYKLGRGERTMTDEARPKITYATKEETDELVSLYTCIGLALTGWQKVEEAHYLLFVKLLEPSKAEICSAIYFQFTSFSSRCNMIDKIVQLAIEDEDLKQQWSELSKRSKTEAAERNKIAHYDLHFDISDRLGPDDFDKAFPRLQPSKHKGKKDCQLIAYDVYTRIWTFRDLSHDIQKFTERL